MDCFSNQHFYYYVRTIESRRHREGGGAPFPFVYLIKVLNARLRPRAHARALLVCSTMNFL